MRSRRISLSCESRSWLGGLALALVGGCGPLVLGCGPLCLGCGPLATAPTWAGGGMAVTGPVGGPPEPTVSDASSAPAARGGERIGARHVLVMHADSRARPDHVVRTKAEALTRAEECLAKLQAGADFSEMVERYSDEPGAAERGGDLGVVGREAMVKAFSAAAFALEVGALSRVVETPYGFHVIKRTR